MFMGARQSTLFLFVFFFSSRRRHTRCSRDWSSDVCSSDLRLRAARPQALSDDVTARLEALESRLQDLQQEQAETQERLDFAERLLSKARERSEERRVGKEGRSRWSPDH